MSLARPGRCHLIHQGRCRVVSWPLRTQKRPPFKAVRGTHFPAALRAATAKRWRCVSFCFWEGKTHTHTHALAHCTDSLTRSFAGVGRCFYIFNCLLIATRVTTGCCGRCADALDARAHKGVCAKPLPKCTTTNRECIKCGVRCVCVCARLKDIKAPANLKAT